MSDATIREGTYVELVDSEGSLHYELIQVGTNGNVTIHDPRRHEPFTLTVDETRDRIGRVQAMWRVTR